MRRVTWMALICLAGALALGGVAGEGWAQQKKLVFWTMWDQNPEFNKWYETRGKDFAKKTGYEVEAVTIPYQGYEAKYLAAFMGKSGAPDMFMGMTHHWCGQYDFCDKMPADLLKAWDQSLPKYMLPVGMWKGARYGMPIEHGNFQMMYINVDLFKKAGLNPDRPPKSMDERLAAMKKLTVLDAKGYRHRSASPSGTKVIPSASRTNSCHSPTRSAPGC
ncbi:MAG: carbohydrate ABC transporter substrate-binding protein [candidate division NC10 bacterium]|nr:carbohydrate ABC transporter substrate-binding protein [candidate division NC10 bacterium]